MLDWRKSKVLTRLSGPRLFDQRFFWWTFFTAFVLQITFDVIAYDSPSWLWLPVWTGGHLAATLVAIVIRWGFLDAHLSKHPNPYLNIAVAAVLGIVRITFIGYVSFVLELQGFFDLQARIIAGSIAGVIGFIVIVNYTESSKSYRELSRALTKTQSHLATLRKDIIAQVQISQLEAQRQIQQIIEPRLKQLSELLDVRTVKDSEKRIISSEIRKLLDGEIRSITARYKKPTKVLQDRSTFRAVPKRDLFSFPDLVSPHLAVKPFMVSLATLAGLPFALYVFEDASWVPIGMLIVGLDFLALLLGKLVLQTFRPMRLIWAIVSLVIVATVPVVLNYPMLVIAQFPPEPIPYVVLFSAVTIYVSMVGFGLIVVHDYNRDSYIRKLERNNKRIERELALVNQQIWVERRKWALRIHGTVQASLTAALVRLSKTGTLGDEDIKLIRAHISQARKGLVANDDVFDFAKSIRDIKKTWAGLIDIKIHMSSEGAKLLLANKWAGVCANEIIKESVSNSMKHGKANRVEISFETSDPGFVRIVAQDNGKGLPNQFRPGLGSQILDEIAHPWSLTKVTGGTRLEARIPVAKKKLAS